MSDEKNKPQHPIAFHVYTLPITITIKEGGNIDGRRIVKILEIKIKNDELYLIYEFEDNQV